MSPRQTRTRMPIVALLSAIAAICLILPAASLAQSSSVGGYGGNGGEVQSALNGGADGGSADSGASAEAGSLPFTGLDLGWMLGGGIVLVGAGIAMGRAASRAPHPR